MGDDSPSNIFDFASKGEKGSEASSRPRAKEYAKGKASSPEEVRRWLKESQADREELEHLFSQIKGKYGEFNRKMDEFCKPSGLTTEGWKAYYEDPANFTPEQWGQLQTERKRMENEIKSMSKQAEFEGGAISGSKKGLANNRKGKMLGARRQWLNMH